MKIKTLLLGNMQTNGYVVSDENHHCLIIDPGANGKKVVHYLTENELVPEAVLLTHGHFDHIGAVDYLYEHYHCPIYLHQDDLEMLDNPQLNLSVYENPFTVKAHLPGHCPGSSMIYLKDENIIFSGDVLFKGSIGRFDFPNSSKYETIESINKIKEYDFDAVIYPGHGPNSTLSEERLNNPYLKKS